MSKLLKFPYKASPSSSCFTDATLLQDRTILGRWKTDANGLETEVSPKWLEITGQTATEANYLGWVHCVHPDDRERVGRTWFKSFANATPVNIEFRALAITGEWILVICRGEPVFNPDARITHWEGEALFFTELPVQVISINQ